MVVRDSVVEESPLNSATSMMSTITPPTTHIQGCMVKPVVVVVVVVELELEDPVLSCANK